MYSKKAVWIIAGVLVVGIIALASTGIFNSKNGEAYDQSKNLSIEQPKINSITEPPATNDNVIKYQTVKVFFNNTIFDPGLTDCSKVYPVNRQITSTQAVGRAALEQLLEGLISGESDNGYLTNLNTGIKIQKLAIENGVAKVDFNEQLQYQVGGSCRTAAITAQITETLKQFPTVKQVIISIDGATEDILQP